MRKILLNITVALVAFWIGVAAEMAFSRYLASTPARKNCKSVYRKRVVQIPPRLNEQPSTLSHPTRLPTELERIDELYRRQCQVPTDWGGDWPTIAQLDRLRTCNDQWARARRKAIDEELSKYMVRY